MATMKLDIEKFDRSVNFGLWQVKMKAILIQNGVHKALDGEEKKPEGTSEAKWEEMDAKALSAIQLCLSNEVLREVVKGETSKDIWEKLKSLYMEKSVINRILLKSRLYDIRLQEGKPMKLHLDEFYSIIMDLQNIDVKVDYEDLAILLLVSLPPSHKHFRETLLYGRDKLSTKDVRKALTQEDLIDSQFAQKESKESNDALFVEELSRSKRGMTCNFCKKKGHLKKDCWKLKAKQSDESKSAKTSSAVASYVESEDYDVGALVVTNEYKGGDSWILDSGCSRHMTFNSNFFSTCQKVDGRKVSMGNEASCPIVGAGDVKFIMFDGFVRTLIEVLRVLSMNRHLISLCILDKEGFRCIGKGGVLKVGKGPNLFLKGSIDDGL